jgi:hypothetical protein
MQTIWNREKDNILLIKEILECKCLCRHLTEINDFVNKFAKFILVDIHWKFIFAY